MIMRTPGQVKFIKALSLLKAEGALENSIFISAASLRILGIRVYTYFIDLLVQRDYYYKKADETNFIPRYDLEPIPIKLQGFSTRIGSVTGNLCSFRHLVKPYNVYEEVEFVLSGKIEMIKIRPRNYVRKDSEEAIEKLIQGSNETYWSDLYSYHKQLEAIDLGIKTDGREIEFEDIKYLKFED